MSDTKHPSLWWTADKSALVEAGDPAAASLAYGPADPIAPEHKELAAGVVVAEPDADPDAEPAPVGKPRGKKA